MKSKIRHSQTPLWALKTISCKKNLVPFVLKLKGE